MNRTVISFEWAEYPFLYFPCNKGWPLDIALTTPVVEVDRTVPAEFHFPGVDSASWSSVLLSTSSLIGVSMEWYEDRSHEGIDDIWDLVPLPLGFYPPTSYEVLTRSPCLMKPQKRGFYITQLGAIPS